LIVSEFDCQFFDLAEGDPAAPFIKLEYVS
jgi:hypothetical protein